MSLCESALFKRALENENNAVISTLNTRKITAEKLHFLRKLSLSPSELQDFMTKLKDYRHVVDLNGITHGAYIRWIDLKHPDRLTLSRGALICDIKIGQKGVLLLCKTHPNPAMFHVSMDECLIFQRLSQQERILLVAMDYLDTGNSDDEGEGEGDDEGEGEGDDEGD
jgi:hypothetical protein|uniref:Uncharacterized protein n=1 Tax=viral metagenome TaxID=1070528 RepID=A0A6C0M2E1_9ZZZZ